MTDDLRERVEEIAEWLRATPFRAENAPHPEDAHEMYQDLKRAAAMLTDAEPEIRCAMCDEPAQRVTETAPMKWGEWPAVDVEHKVIKCGACGESFYETGEYDAAIFQALQLLLRDHAIPITNAEPVAWKTMHTTLMQYVDKVIAYRDTPGIPEQVKEAEAAMLEAEQFFRDMCPPVATERQSRCSNRLTVGGDARQSCSREAGHTGKCKAYPKCPVCHKRRRCDCAAPVATEEEK